MRNVAIGVLLWAAAIEAAAQVDCAGIADDTVKELRAGVGDAWTEATEHVVRLAAASGCSKAQSGRYSDSGDNREDVVIAEPQSIGGAAATSEPQTAGNQPSGDVESAVDTSDSGLTFRPLSGPPTRKPYERARQSRDDQGDERSPTSAR